MRMAEHRDDGGKGHAGGDRHDPVGLAQPLGAGLGALDDSDSHEACDVPARGGAGKRPGPRPRASTRVKPAASAMARAIHYSQS